MLNVLRFTLGFFALFYTVLFFTLIALLLTGNASVDFVGMMMLFPMMPFMFNFVAFAILDITK